MTRKRFIPEASDFEVLKNHPHDTVSLYDLRQMRVVPTQATTVYLEKVGLSVIQTVYAGRAKPVNLYDKVAVIEQLERWFFTSEPQGKPDLVDQLTTIQAHIDHYGLGVTALARGQDAVIDEVNRMRECVALLNEQAETQREAHRHIFKEINKLRELLVKQPFFANPEPVSETA